MKALTKRFFIAAAAVFAAQPAFGGQFDVRVPMMSKGVSTYYVPGEITGVGQVDFMVDTGSGYTTINEETLAALVAQDRARFVRKLTGRLADGSSLTVPVYNITEMNIGGQCKLENVEAAVFPGKTRHILGLSVLNRAAPFIFSIDPPELTLSNCVGTPT